MNFTCYHPPHEPRISGPGNSGSPVEWKLNLRSIGPTQKEMLLKPMWYLITQIWWTLFLMMSFLWMSFFTIHFYSLQILLLCIAAVHILFFEKALNAPPVCSDSQVPSPGRGCCTEETLLSAGLRVDSSLWNLWILSLTRTALPLSSRWALSLASDGPKSFFWTTFAISATKSDSDSAFSVGLYLCTWTTSSLSPSSLESSE